MLKIIPILWVIVFAVFPPVFGESLNSDINPPGVTIFSPLPGQEIPTQFTLKGKVWDNTGAAKVTVFAKSADGSFTRQFDGIIDRVIYKGEVLYTLGTYSAKIELPEGSYTVWTEAIDFAGNPAVTGVRTIGVNPSAAGKGFVFYSIQHWMGLLAVVLSIIGMALILKRLKSPVAEKRTEWILAAFLWSNELMLNIYYLATDAYRIGNHLPFHLCGMSVVLIPFMFFVTNEKAKKTLYEIIYFWGLGGATQALLTPDIGLFNFPHFRYFSFFISHGAIVASAIYMTFIRGYKPTLKSLGKVLLFTNALILLMFGVNYLAQFVPPYEVGNYFFLSYPPVDGSVIDVMVDIFGPAPRYVIGLEIMGILIFIALYLPFGIGSIVGRIRDRQNKVPKAENAD
ncbi:MAG: TIGR02206 family membrane protein [Brevinematales bacterium]|nr:TIGR02206 family membrane protein [Brevinematales bacterium]